MSTGESNLQVSTTRGSFPYGFADDGPPFRAEAIKDTCLFLAKGPPGAAAPSDGAAAAEARPRAQVGGGRGLQGTPGEEAVPVPRGPPGGRPVSERARSGRASVTPR